MNISLYCNYHRATGSTFAISCIANQLSTKHNVDAYVTRDSSYSRLLTLRVRQTFRPRDLHGDIFLVDIEQKNATLERLLANNKRVLLSCHALPVELHSVPQPMLRRNLELATSIHFVSEFQRSEFVNHYPDLDIEAKSFVIPNYTRQSSKHVYTGNAGIVGYLTRPKKNALKAIELAQRSNARLIQCWGTDTIAGVEKPVLYSKLRIRGWTNNLRDMHESFDVLISTSQFETFGLVVVEALSAGIPCVLSDIPVFRSLFSGCEGVVILSGNDEQDVRSINQLLEQAPALKNSIIRSWRNNFSNEAVKASWLDMIHKL
ncbi:MAG: glycosyltransferase family 4 protein [Desulfobacteraceae bacterium]|nr:glycosyltransferase family 4 protein [Desulfobacteraceae bacterium]